MKIVIDIPKRYFNMVKDFETVNLSRCNYKTVQFQIINAIKNGTPLPKGHGRLIDADDIDNHIIGHVDTRSCPTIIEADKEGAH